MFSNEVEEMFTIGTLNYKPVKMKVAVMSNSL